MSTSTLPVTWPVSQFIDLLRSQRSTLAARYHIASLAVFGSYVQNNQHAGSDLDVLVDFSKTPSLFTLIALQDELSTLLGVPVDLVMQRSLKPRIGKQILSELVEV